MISSSSSSSVNVVSYNVLSEKLCNWSYFDKSNPDDCDKDIRYERVSKKVAEQIELKSIICMQEVSRSWLEKMIPLFSESKYSYVSYQGHKAKNGYMGPCVAWPTERYHVKDVKMDRVTDTLKWPAWSQLSQKSEKNISSAKEQEEDNDSWKATRSRKNGVVLVRLCPADGGDPFVIGNYHMPCLFGSDQACQSMVAHAIMVIRAAQKFSQDDPLVLAGDWNITPDSATYEMIQNRVLPDTHPQMPPRNNHTPYNWKPTLERRLRSAYNVANGREPDFTNHAWTSAMPEPFTETLDYIWISDHWDVESVMKLPGREMLENIKSFPVESEPSDHIMIGATLSL